MSEHCEQPRPIGIEVRGDSVGLTSATPVFNAPLLIVERNHRVLVAADIHLGLEHELWLCGVSIPSQTDKLLELLKEQLQKVDPDRLVLLGDIKHNVPRTCWQEKQEVPHFLKSLSSMVDVDLVPGNHDGGLTDLAPPGTRVMPSSGYILDGVGYFHGHTWPDQKLFNSNILVAGHIHPALRLRDLLGHSVAKPAWARVPLSEEAVMAHYGSHLPTPELVIVPAFNQLCGGLSLNEPNEEERGPILAMAKMDCVRMYLLDGTDLGKLGDIRAARKDGFKAKRGKSPGDGEVDFKEN
jgi:putative SbcD/Mre11-related phosphoesterase